MLIRYASIPTNNTSHKRSSFLPDYVASSVANIDFDLLRRRGITTALIDLDGTVVTRGAYDVSEQIRQALSDSGLDIYIATNRSKSRDLKNLKQDLGAVGVIHPVGMHGKPTTKYFQTALRDHNLRASEVVMIGDRYLQDIFGGNRVGLLTLLVEKIELPEKLYDRLFSGAEQFITRVITKSYIESSCLPD